MKHNCDVIRDLMPLCVDNAASEASRRMLADHLAECSECTESYNEMKTELPPETLEHPNFDAEVKLLQKAQQRRKRKSILIGILIGVLVVVGLGFFIYKNIFFFDYYLPVDQFDIQLSRRENGDVIMTRKQYDVQSVGWGTHRQLDEGRWVYMVRSNVLKNTVPTEFKVSSVRENELIWVEGEGLFWERMVYDEEQNRYTLERQPIEEIWAADDIPLGETWVGDELMYTRGDDLPMVSPELEAFISNEDMYLGTREEYWEERLQYYNQQRQQDEKRDTYRENRESIIKNIPEWQ